MKIMLVSWVSEETRRRARLNRRRAEGVEGRGGGDKENSAGEVQQLVDERIWQCVGSVVGAEEG